MSWKKWLIHYCPKDWSNEDALTLIRVDCPEVTLEDIKRERPIPYKVWFERQGPK